VAPADLLGVLGSGVLGVMNDKVRASEEFAMSQVFAADLARSVS
jgi:hypothetical protein